MPVRTVDKVSALRDDFGSESSVADLPGVGRTRVSEWLSGGAIDPLDAERIDLLELVWANLIRLYEPEAAHAWLLGLNPSLGHRRPIDLIQEGRIEDLMRAIRAERAGSFA